MTAGTDVYYCSDRSSAYEIQKLLQGGSDLCRDLLLYGTPEPEDVNYAKKHLFPVPLGGLEGATPDTGWTFVQIPGMDKYLCCNSVDPEKHVITKPGRSNDAQMPFW